MTLTATPAFGSIFTGWDGCDAVSETTCTLALNGERSVRASFVGQPSTNTANVVTPAVRTPIR